MSGEAVVALALRAEKWLVVWNKRCGAWGLPGRKVEQGERLAQALEREVREETGCGLRAWWHVHVDRHDESQVSTRVYAYRVILHGEPRETEPGCPITWFTQEELLKWGLAPAYYAEMFKALENQSAGMKGYGCKCTR